MGALSPILAPHQLPLVAMHTADLVRETAGRGQLSAYVEEDFHTAAMALVRYRLSTLAIARQTDRDARRMFLADLRVMGRNAFPEMQRLMHPLAHFVPALKQRASPNGPTFEEVLSPVKLRGYISDFSCVGDSPNRIRPCLTTLERIWFRKIALTIPPSDMAKGRVKYNLALTPLQQIRGGCKFRPTRPTL